MGFIISSSLGKPRHWYSSTLGDDARRAGFGGYRPTERGGGRRTTEGGGNRPSLSRAGSRGTCRVSEPFFPPVVEVGFSDGWRVSGCFG